MAGSAALVDVLKRELKARGITYAQIARGLNKSEASVKRMFSRRTFTLDRIDGVCRIAGIEFSDLTRVLNRQEAEITQLTYEQEKQIIANKKLFLVAVCALNHVTFEQIVQAFEISRAECIELLSQLDRLKFLELQPNNRIKLLVSRTFSWRPDGPIQRFFNQQAHNEYFRSSFQRPGEFMLVVNGMLTEGSSIGMVEKLKRIAKEFSELHNQDVSAPLVKRSAMSLLVAIRHWELQAFGDLRRHKSRTPPTAVMPGQRGRLTRTRAPTRSTEEMT
jgi:transcriptional regulator with XRE-family HTH domain